MKHVVVYYSCTGNTQGLAEAMAREVGTTAYPLALAKKGRKGKEDAARERALWDSAIDAVQHADCVLIGTPTEFRRPHPLVVKLVGHAVVKRAATFCTFHGMLGATLTDLEALLRQKGTRYLGGLAVCVGTEAYRARMDVSQYVDRLRPAHLARASAFAREVVARRSETELRLRGVCGRDCRECADYKSGGCEGAGARCWSGRDCRVFECCVIKRSLGNCGECGRACRLLGRQLATGT